MTQQSRNYTNISLHKSILHKKCTIFNKETRKRVNCWTAITPDFANSQKPANLTTLTEIKGHIILTCTSSSLWCQALRENLTLEALLKLGRALALSAKQAKDVEDTRNDSVNKNNTRGWLTKSPPQLNPWFFSVTAQTLTVRQSSLWRQTRQIFTKMWQLWWICSSQKSVPSARKNLQHLRKNWSFC